MANNALKELSDEALAVLYQQVQKEMVDRKLLNNTQKPRVNFHHYNRTKDPTESDSLMFWKKNVNSRLTMADARTLVEQLGPVGPEGLQYFTETKKGYYIAQFDNHHTASAVYEAVRANGYRLGQVPIICRLIKRLAFPNAKREDNSNGNGCTDDVCTGEEQCY